MKKVVKLISIILAIAMFIGGCGTTDNKEDTSDKTQNVVKNDSEYINLTMMKPETINPILNTNKSVSYILDLVYDSLFEFDENYNLQSKLVESYDIASNNKSVKITLKDDIKWHNGKTLTASDVQYTVNLIKISKESAYYSLISNISTVHVNGQRTLTVYFKQADSFCLETLIFPIVSRNKLAQVAVNSKGNYKYNLIGCGEYKIKEYEDREYMILERYDEYYNSSSSNNDREIYVKMVPDVDSQTQMVLSNDSDMTKVTLGDISKFTNIDKFSIETYQGRNYEYVLFNYQNEYLQNKDIRKAISFAIDRKSIIEDAYSGRLTMLNFPLSSNSNYYDNELKPLSYNTDNAENYLKKAVISIEEEKARKLEEAKEKQKKKEEEIKNNSSNNSNNNSNSNNGNSGNNNSGSNSQQPAPEQGGTEADEPTSEDTTATVVQRTIVAGAKKRYFKDVKASEVNKLLKELKLKIIVNKNNSERLRAASEISENLDQINIKTEIAVLSDKEMQDALNSNDYDLALIGCELPAVSNVKDIITHLGYEDEKLDNYFNRLQNAKSEEQKIKIYKEIQTYVKDNAIFISFGLLENYVVLNNRLKGELYSNEFNIYRGISDFKIN